MNIRQISDGSVETNYVLDVWMQQNCCPILNQAQFYTVNGPTNSFILNSDNSAKTLITRSLNAANSATGPTPS